jgi:uncharacterized protein (TIGR02058 family)
VRSATQGKATDLQRSPACSRGVDLAASTTAQAGNTVALKRLVLEMGMGTDLHGRDYTKAAVRALRDALWHNSLTVVPALGYDRNDMRVEVIVGVADPAAVDCDAVAAVLPYGTATVSCVEGGLDVPSDDGQGMTVIANAAVVVWLDVDEVAT